MSIILSIMYNQQDYDFFRMQNRSYECNHDISVLFHFFNSSLRTHLNGPLTRYIKLRIAHAPGMPIRFPRHRSQRKPLVSAPSMHHGTGVTYVPWCMSGSVPRGGGENVSWHFWRKRNPQIYVSGKRSIAVENDIVIVHIDLSFISI